VERKEEGQKKLLFNIDLQHANQNAKSEGQFTEGKVKTKGESISYLQSAANAKKNQGGDQNRYQKMIKKNEQGEQTKTSRSNRPRRDKSTLEGKRYWKTARHEKKKKKRVQSTKTR